jgi:hypothetical protein
MCLRRAPEKYIAGAALDRAELHRNGGEARNEALVEVRVASFYEYLHRYTESDNTDCIKRFYLNVLTQCM